MYTCVCYKVETLRKPWISLSNYGKSLSYLESSMCFLEVAYFQCKCVFFFFFCNMESIGKTIRCIRCHLRNLQAGLET